MKNTYWIVPSVAGALLLTSIPSQPVEACCPAPRSGQPGVNAGQTIFLLWDVGAQTEHFLRPALFKSEGDDFGFLIPSPSRPELAESGNEAFPVLQKITEPEIIERTRPRGGSGCACDDKKGSAQFANVADKAEVRILEEKMVAGFNAK